MLGARLEVRPAGLLGHPEHVLGEVLVGILRRGRILGQQGCPLRLESVGDVPQEDQPEDDVLVVRGFEVLAQLVGGEEQLRLEAERRAVAIGLFGGGRRGGAVLVPLRSSTRHRFAASLTRVVGSRSGYDRAKYWPSPVRLSLNANDGSFIHRLHFPRQRASPAAPTAWAWPSTGVAHPTLARPICLPLGGSDEKVEAIVGTGVLIFHEADWRVLPPYEGAGPTVDEKAE